MFFWNWNAFKQYVSPYEIPADNMVPVFEVHWKNLCIGRFESLTMDGKLKLIVCNEIIQNIYIQKFAV